MELLHPGVYVQEVSSGVRPIEGVSTSTTAFLGKTEKGPLNSAFMVTSFIEFQTNYGSFLNDSFLAHAALAYFNNGGRRLYIARVASGAAIADVTIADRKGTPAKTIVFSANSAGKWGNALTVVVGDSTLEPSDQFKLTVRQNNAPAEVFDNLSMNPAASNFVDNVIGAGSQLIRSSADQSNDSNVAGNSVSGAGAAVSLPPNRRRMLISLNGDGAQAITLADPCTTGAEIATAIQTA